MRGLGLTMAAGLALAGCATARTEPQPAAAAAALPECASGAVGTRQTAAIGGSEMAYRVCAGTLAVRDAAGVLLAELFYTAYLATPKAGHTRPISFVWNGGPGADSRLLHFHALGPKTLEDGALADNSASPLAASDLVFLDPAGTGFSRPASDAAAARLYSTTGDLAATAAFIRAFREAYGREAAPLYLIGESFGTWRAAGVAEMLIDDGVDVAGMALISGGIPLGEESDRPLMRALSLPNRTATALALGRLDPALQAEPEATLAAAERWASAVWYPALRDPAALSSDARAEVVAGLARYHGLPPERIDAETLWISPRDFRTGLLAERGVTLDIFDMRETRAEDAAGQAAEERAVIAYYRETLGVRDGAYAGIEVDPLPVGAEWGYDQAPITEESLARAIAGEGPPSPSQPWTLRAMRKAPALRTWVAAGLYDSLNSCAANAATVAALPADIAARITLRCYPGGHMMYDAEGQAERFGNELSAFLKTEGQYRRLD